MPLSTSFRREMLVAIKNAKKAKDKQSEDIPSAEEASESGIDESNVDNENPNGSAVLIKPIASNQPVKIEERESNEDNTSNITKETNSNKSVAQLCWWDNLDDSLNIVQGLGSNLFTKLRI